MFSVMTSRMEDHAQKFQKLLKTEHSNLDVAFGSQKADQLQRYQSINQRFSRIRYIYENITDNCIYLVVYVYVTTIQKTTVVILMEYKNCQLNFCKIYIFFS